MFIEAVHLAFPPAETISQLLRRKNGVSFRPL